MHKTAALKPIRLAYWLGILLIAGIVQLAAVSRPSADTSPPGERTSDDASGSEKPTAEAVDLPKNVKDMREMLLAATQSARVEDLITPYEWNELPPVISNEKVSDPIAYWKKISRDGGGLEILNIMHKLLNLPPAKLHIGPDHENSALYVWPYLAELDLTKLTTRQQFELRTLVPPAEANKIFKSNKWTWWRLAIGADGTWHSFMKYDTE